MTVFHLVLTRLRYWRVLFAVICTVVAAQALFGELFYKNNIGGLYFTELALVFVWLSFLFVLTERCQIPYVPYVTPLMLLSAAYVVYSVTQDRPAVWLVRQSVFLVYMSVGLIGCMAARSFQDSSNWGKVFTCCGAFSASVIAMHRLLPVFPGLPVFTALLVFLLGQSYWVLSRKTLLEMVLVGVVCVGFVFLIGKQTSWAGASLIVLAASIYIRSKRRLRPFLALALVLAAVATFLSHEGLMDYNAVWRYLYWYGILEESWNNGYFLLGQGFGITFMPEGSESFGMLLSQVQKSDPLYQLYTVPPHNGLLTILLYVGLPGVIIFLYPFWKGYRAATRNMFTLNGEVVFVSLVAHLALLVSNQFLEVPYLAVTFWLLYGFLVFFVTDGRSGGRAKKLDEGPQGSRITPCMIKEK